MGGRRVKVRDHSTRLGEQGGLDITQMVRSRKLMDLVSKLYDSPGLHSNLMVEWQELR